MADVKVRAVENGHDGVTYRHAGEEFLVDAKRMKDGSTWFVEASKAPEPAPDEQ
jgi:hypothetical protein